MDNPLSVSEVKEFIRKAEESFRHEDCKSCECYLGYIAQLKIDSSQEAKKFIESYMPDREQIHACLGCDPCPPGVLYSAYLRKKKKS